MKKYITILLVATVALAACSQIEPETQEGYTLTLYATKDTDGVATKALSLEEKTLGHSTSLLRAAAWDFPRPKGGNQSRAQTKSIGRELERCLFVSSPKWVCQL